MNEKQGTGAGQAGIGQSRAPDQAGGNRGMAEGKPQGSGGSPESLVDQATNTAADLAGRASDVAREAYDQGQRYVRHAGDRYPQAQRYYRRAAQSIEHQFTVAPLISLLAVGAVGLGLAWIIGGLARSQERAPSGARSRGDHPGQRSGKRLIESDRVEGTAVYDQSGKRIGTVERVMIDKLTGRVAYAVMSFGGFFGVGADEYAVPWSTLDYDPRLGGYRTQITAEQLRRAPRLSQDRGQDWPDRESEQNLHDYYQVSYYWLLT
ncbi:PRC-barrel domain-containing protein [Microvirga sp. M2]|uniref:PRC-barrel domain-containing protein n=1 Tax=Microvirga sp. M2 TaxID=3073270 RepID=UPI0039C36070